MLSLDFIFLNGIEIKIKRVVPLSTRYFEPLSEIFFFSEGWTYSFDIPFLAQKLFFKNYISFTFPPCRDKEREGTSTCTRKQIHTVTHAHSLCLPYTHTAHTHTHTQVAAVFIIALWWDLLRRRNHCMLTYADVCWRMLAYAGCLFIYNSLVLGPPLKKKSRVCTNFFFSYLHTHTHTGCCCIYDSLVVGPAQEKESRWYTQPQHFCSNSHFVCFR